MLTTGEEKQKKRLKLNSSNTLQVNKGSAKVCKKHLKVKGENENFQDFDNVKLEEMLGHFYMDLRREDGSHYKVNSLETVRHSINRYLKSFNRKVDIVKNSLFTDSNTCFKAVLAEDKRMGKGDVVHHPIISDIDLKSLYTSMHLSINTPQGLFNKVQFVI